MTSVNRPIASAMFYPCFQGQSSSFAVALETKQPFHLDDIPQVSDGFSLLKYFRSCFEKTGYSKPPKILYTKVSDKMVYTKSAEPDQTAPESDQGLHYLPFH